MKSLHSSFKRERNQSNQILILCVWFVYRKQVSATKLTSKRVILKTNRAPRWMEMVRTSMLIGKGSLSGGRGQCSYITSYMFPFSFSTFDVHT